jgi:hypothetical protein
LCDGAEKSAPFLFFKPVNRADRPPHSGDGARRDNACGIGADDRGALLPFRRTASRKLVGSGPERLTLKHLRLKVVQYQLYVNRDRFIGAPPFEQSLEYFKY